jgi:phospholipase/lecithinase/hemolysin
MATQWLRRAWLAAVGASVLLLAACGGSKVESPLSPSRIIAFGDAMADIGQNGRRYTVNDSTANNWTLFVAAGYNLTLTPSSNGGLSFATGNARVRLEPDAAGSNATPTVTEQVTAFLAANSPQDDDLILVNAGTSDVIVEVRDAIAGTQTGDQMIADVERAARDLADQVQRLVNAGAAHVVVAGPYNLGRSPWALQTRQEALMQEASNRFNQALLLALNGKNFGDRVLYVDTALAFNELSSNQRGDFTNVIDPVCTSVDPGPGIGTGPNQVNSNLCTTGTLVAGANYQGYLWADRVYPTPRGHELFGNFALDRIQDRW